MAQAIQSIFKEIIDIVYPNNYVICHKLVEENNNCICNRYFSKFETTVVENWIDKLRFYDSIDEVYSPWYAINSINNIDSLSIAIIDEVITIGLMLSVYVVELKDCCARNWCFMLHTSI